MGGGGGGAGKTKFYPYKEGGQKSFNAEKGRGSKQFLNLNTMSRVLISIITNSKKKTLKCHFQRSRDSKFSKFHCSAPQVCLP
jgi:hypothetical protein